jgi:hypothetical protein
MPALPQTAVAVMKISLWEKLSMLIDSFLFNSYVRILNPATVIVSIEEAAV